MRQNNAAMMIDTTQSNTNANSNPPNIIVRPQKTPGLKNLAAFYELMQREGYCLPDLSSKFVNQVTLTLMYTNKIYNLKQEDVVYRECVKPPSKQAMVAKLEQYLADIRKPSGIEKQNYPDKRWLVLAVATLSAGQDEIFDPVYMPSKPLAKEVELQMQQNQLKFQHVMPHLLAKGKGRSLNFNPLTKAQKLQIQLQQAEDRIARQNADKKRISE